MPVNVSGEGSKAKIHQSESIKNTPNDSYKGEVVRRKSNRKHVEENEGK